MKEKITKTKEIRKLREAFRTQYTKFQKEHNELGQKFRQITIDADLMLAAAEEIIGFQDKNE